MVLSACLLVIKGGLQRGVFVYVRHKKDISPGLYVAYGP